MAIKKLGLALAVTMSLIAATSASAQSIGIDRSFNSVKIPWRNAGETVLIYKVINMDGKTGVCGAYLSAGGSVAATEKHLLNALYVKMGKTTVINSMRHMTKAKGSTPVSKIKAKCRKGRKAWKPAYAKTRPELKTSQSNFEF